MKQVGIVGWRGMVGSVLLQRMIEENDFDNISAHFSAPPVQEPPVLSLMASATHLKMLIL